MIKRNTLIIPAFAAFYALSFFAIILVADATPLPPAAEPAPVKLAIPDVTTDPAFKKAKDDLESSKATIAQLQQLIQTIQTQRDSFSKAYLDAQAQISLLQSELAAMNKQIEDLKKPAATTTAAAPSK